MNRTTSLLETLKKYLKAKGITYRQLAADMQLSEASVKRLFSRKTFTLERLEEVCRILDIDFYDLALMDEQRNRNAANILTIEQERFLAQDPKLFVFLYFLVNGWTVQLIKEEYDYSEIEANKMLGQLERLGVLERHPNDRIRLLISKNIFWQTDGPLQEQYNLAFMDDFMQSQFNHPNEYLVFAPGQLVAGVAAAGHIVTFRSGQNREKARRHQKLQTGPDEC